LVARSEDALARAAEELKAARIGVAPSAYDLKNTEGIAAWFERVRSPVWAADILVNAAGINTAWRGH